MENGTGKDIPSGIPSTPDELIRVLAEYGTKASRADADEFFAFFGMKGWMHQGQPLSAGNWTAAFTWHRMRLLTDEARALKKKAA